MASTASASNAMHVAVEVIFCERKVHVNHMFHTGNVKATCCYVCGHKHAALTFSELPEPVPTDSKHCQTDVAVQLRILAKQNS
jgi:hypothetical protein